MATIGATVGDLVLRHVEGIHDSVAALVPASASVSLAVRGIVAAPAGTAGVVKTSTDLASDTDCRVRLTA